MLLGVCLTGCGSVPEPERELPNGCEAFDAYLASNPRDTDTRQELTKRIGPCVDPNRASDMVEAVLKEGVPGTASTLALHLPNTQPIASSCLARLRRTDLRPFERSRLALCLNRNPSPEAYEAHAMLIADIDASVRGEAYYNFLNSRVPKDRALLKPRLEIEKDPGARKILLVVWKSTTPKKRR